MPLRPPRFRRPAVVLLTFALLVPSAHAPAEPAAAERIRLDNGLVVLKQKTDRTPYTIALLAYRVGSRHDPPGRAGLTHLLGRTLLRAATPSFPPGALERTLAGAGPTRLPGLDSGMEILPDLLLIHSVTRPAALPDALKAFAEQMRDARFDPAVIEEAREAALDASRRSSANPAAVLHNTVLATAHTRLPCRYPALGLPEEIQAATPAELKSHYDRYCRPDNATLVLMGALPETVGEQVRDAFAGLAASGGIPAPDAVAEPAQDRERRVALSLAAEAAQVMVAWRAPPPGARDKAALQIVAAHLQNVLAQRLLAPGTAAFVAVEDDLLAAEGGLFLVHAAAAPGKSIDTVEKRIRTAVAEVRDGGVPEVPMQALRIRIASGFRRLDPDLDGVLRGAPDPVPTLLRIAAIRARVESALAPVHAAFLQALESVGPAEVRAAAGRWLADDRVTVATLIPKAAPDRRPGEKPPDAERQER